MCGLLGIIVIHGMIWGCSAGETRPTPSIYFFISAILKETDVFYHAGMKIILEEISPDRITRYDRIPQYV
jgi:hypothetical protein